MKYYKPTQCMHKTPQQTIICVILQYVWYRSAKGLREVDSYEITPLKATLLGHARQQLG